MKGRPYIFVYQPRPCPHLERHYSLNMPLSFWKTLAGSCRSLLNNLVDFEERDLRKGLVLRTGGQGTGRREWLRCSHARQESRDSSRESCGVLYM